MASKLEKAILDRMDRSTQSIKDMYSTKMLSAEKKVNDLKKQIAEGDTSEETKQKLIDAEEELTSASVGYYESRY